MFKGFVLKWMIFSSLNDIFLCMKNPVLQSWRNRGKSSIWSPQFYHTPRRHPQRALTNVRRQIILFSEITIKQIRNICTASGFPFYFWHMLLNELRNNLEKPARHYQCHGFCHIYEQYIYNGNQIFHPRHCWTKKHISLQSYFHFLFIRWMSNSMQTFTLGHQQQLQASSAYFPWSSRT